MIFYKNLDNTQKSFFLTTIILIFYSSINTGALNFGNYSFLLVLLILFGIYFLAYKILDLISYNPIYLSSIVVIIFIKSTIFSYFPSYIYLPCLLILILSIYFILKRSVFKSFVFLVILFGLLYFFFSEKQLHIIDSNNLFDVQKGNEEYSYFTYSPGEDNHRKEYQDPDIISYYIDASDILDVKWNQSKIKWRENYWSFSKENLPLNGRIWIPKKEGKYPIISIIHGNHSMQEFSDDGYNYLGEFLSSHGYIFNSLDQNFLNGSWAGDFRGSEMTTRAWHFLENLKYLKKLNNDSTSSLYNKIDYDNIIVMGHSRGGEAVNLATKFNDLETFPDNGKVKFDYNFNLKGIVTLAPTDYRYFRNYDLKNVNYLTVQGSMDSDEESFFGLRQANRLENESPLVNVGILIEGANHSQFNTSWGQHDFGFPGKLLVNHSKIIPGWLQRKILKFYLVNFIQYTFNKNKTSLKTLKKSINYPINDSQFYKVISSSAIGDSKILFDFEEDDMLNGDGANLEINNLNEIKLEKLKFRGGKDQQNSALKLELSDSSSFKINIDDIKENKSFAIDLSNENDASNLTIKFYNEKNEYLSSSKVELFNTKIDLNNFKFNFLTEERFKKRNDINFSTLNINLEENTKIIELKFSEGKYYIDNIILNN